MLASSKDSFIRVKQKKPRVGNGWNLMEEIRQKLGMEKNEFSMALGFGSQTGYFSLQNDGVPKLYYLAAKQLLSEAKPQNLEVDDIVIVTYISGNQIRSEFTDKIECINFRGEDFLLVPKPKK